MVDLKGQYRKIQTEVDQYILSVISEANFINGPQVQSFAQNLSDYLGGAQVIPCANGTVERSITPQKKGHITG